MDEWAATEQEQELFRRELDSFVPDRIFDSHVHLYEMSHFTEEDIVPLFERGPDVVGAEAFLRYMNEIHPGRDTTGLCFPFPKRGIDFEATHDFLAGEVAKLPDGRGQMLIKPSLDPEYVRETVRSKGFVGLKPYQVFSDIEGVEKAVESYLPEEHVRVAHEEGLTVTLHAHGSRAPANPVIQEAIRRYATKYPDMKLILAHSARGWNPHHLVEGISALADLGNVWYDTGVVQEHGAFEAIIDAVGHRRLLWGSDFPVSQDRGRCVGVGDGSVWITPEMLAGKAGVAPVMQGYESLRAMKLAAMFLKLTDSQVEDIFYNNLASLYDD